MLQAIFDGKSGLTDPGLLSLVGSLLNENVTEGFGKNFLQVDFATPDAAMLTRLTRDTWHFSAAKNYQQLRDMTLALKDDAGKLRTFADFREAASGISDSYNKTWLKAEYDHAVGSSTMASQWVEFQRNAKLMPFLRYSTVGDAQVRVSHRALDGITRKIDDAFWTTHYPPNGWRCRCDANQLPGSAKETELKDIPSVPIQPMFRTNLAASGMVYPKGHPYYDGVPDNVLKKALAYLPTNAAYNTYKVKNGPVDVHLLHNNINEKGLLELSRHLEMTNDLYAIGFEKAKLLPSIHKADKEIKSKFYPKGYKPVDELKNPDTWIKNSKGNDMVCDYKYITGNGKTLGNHISKGATQAEYVIVKLANKKHDVKTWSAEGLIEAKLKENANLKGVIILNHDGSLFTEKYR